MLRLLVRTGLPRISSLLQFREWFAGVGRSALIHLGASFSYLHFGSTSMISKLFYIAYACFVLNCSLLRPFVVTRVDEHVVTFVSEKVIVA